MTDINHILDRLLKSAATAEPRPIAQLSRPAEMEVLAQWRTARSESAWLSLMPLLRRSVAIACCAAAIALACSAAFKPEAPDEIATLNAVVNLATMP
jgi:hypothetical protein